MNEDQFKNKSGSPVSFAVADLKVLFQSFIKEENLFQPANRLLLAVSGGLDSVVLCDLCSKAGLNFAIAHCNFQLRGKESEEDENFVKELAVKYNVSVFVQNFDTGKYAAENKISIQVAARKLRYEWFAQLLKLQHFDCLLTAHHANDHIETLLMNFFKGTGITGLQGILPKSGKAMEIIRPLLFAKKETLHEYAIANQLVYREDSSNESNKYTRNYFRNKILPAIKEVYPQAEDNLLDNIRRFNEVNILYQQSVLLFRKKNILEKNGEIYLPVIKLSKTAALQTLLFETTKEYNFTSGQMPDIIKLLNSASGKYIDSTTHRILRNRQWLIITKLGEKENKHFLIQENDTEVIFSDQILQIQKISRSAKIDPDRFIAQFDTASLTFPLLLRKWKQGDYFYPLGMKKKKKLSRFFIDIKLSMIEKQAVWVIEMNSKIIWVAGYRIDDRFKINTNTRETTRMVLTTSK